MTHKGRDEGGEGYAKTEGVVEKAIKRPMKAISKEWKVVMMFMFFSFAWFHFSSGSVGISFCGSDAVVCCQ